MANVLGRTTYADVLRAAKEQSDMVNSSFVSDTEWIDFVNASYQELYGLLVQKFGTDYFVQGTLGGYEISTDGTTDFYSLPTDVFKLLGVDVKLTSSSPTSWVTLKPFNFQERNKFGLSNATGRLGVSTLQYRLHGEKLWIIPRAAAGQTIRIFYAPRVTSLDGTAGQALDGVNGWEEYVIIDAAIKAKDKEESDVSVLTGRKGAIIARIESEAATRDAGMPATVVDVRGVDYGSGVDGSPLGAGYGWPY